MKNVNLTISVEQEKLSAIRFYAGKKESSIEAELTDFIDKLYEKYVPAQTREYIESMAAEATEKPKRPARTTVESKSKGADES